ncbi:hypothetical protein [Neolewinella sp.]|uniref:hypothetical protein n=1 Tax=Neolewinella sp. TaxID=2993543 RepID=UPI003B51CF86
MPLQVLITVTDDHKADTAAVADRLKQLGLRVESILPIGVISGVAKASDLPRLRNCPGVATVDEDTPVNIPPPDSLIQ